MKYYIDVTETFTKTVAVEADSFEQAEKRAIMAYKRGEFDVERDIPDDAKFKDATDEIIAHGLDAEDIEEFECHDVVFDADKYAWVCPVCGLYLADRCTAMELDTPLPKHCNECGTELNW